MAIDFNVPSQVRPYANLGAFPATGAVKTIYIAEDTNKTYRWTGSVYVEISPSPTQTSDLTNDGENGINPFITALDIPSSLPPSGTAGGDLTGTYPNPTVHRIHGIDIQNGTPSTDDVLVYGGSPAKWQHQHLNASQVDNDSSVTGATVKLALEHLDSTKVPTSRNLTINGITQDLSANRTFTISTGITIGTTAITSGTNGRFLFDDGGVVSETNGAFWDKVNGRWGIGTSSPSEKLEIVSGAIQLSNAQGIRSRYTGGPAFTILQMFSDNNTYLDGANDILFRVAAGATTAMRLKSTGNVLINTTTDAGFKLDVNGTARVTQMTFPATTDKKIFLYDGITDYAIGLAAGAIRLGTPSGNRVAMGNYTGSTFTEICNVSPTGLNLISGRVDLGADTSNVKLAIYTNTGISMGLGVSASTFRFSAGGTTNNFVFFDDAAGNKLYSLISLTGAGYYGSGTINASSQLQVDSTTRGFLPPRMTQVQRNAIASPAIGLEIYQTDATEGKYIYKSSGWTYIG